MTKYIEFKKPTPGWRGGWPKRDVARARRAARRIGYRVIKQRYRDLSTRGGLRLVDDHNTVVAGADFDLTPEQAIALCDVGVRRAG